MVSMGSTPIRNNTYAKIAQVVERAPEERSVGGSTPSLGTGNTIT